MHAFLIVGNNPKLIQSEVEKHIRRWNISSWDITRFIEEGTVGIEMVRDFQRELSMSPRNSPAKAGVITDIERLTPEAQNALLKTIEEPPPHTYILATTHVPEIILPTVRSRMNVIRLADTPEDTNATYSGLLRDILRSSPGHVLQLAEPYTATRDDAKVCIAGLLTAAHEELHSNPSHRLVLYIRALITAGRQLSVNVNQKLVLDNAMLHYIDNN